MTGKLKMKTADMASENFEKLKALFPNCVTESLDKEKQPRRKMELIKMIKELER